MITLTTKFALGLHQQLASQIEDLRTLMESHILSPHGEKRSTPTICEDCSIDGIDGQRSYNLP
jgi:hypothetical protein